MANETLLFAVLTRALSSALLLGLFYSLVMRVIQNEHAKAYAAHVAYAQYSVTQRLLFILFLGGFIPRVVFIVGLVGLYHGAQFLGKDLEEAWRLYYAILTR